MRRALLALAVLATVLLPSVAHAQTAPTAQFSSPPRAVAGAPIYIRSITPCPVTGGYQFVRVGLTLQSEPHLEELFESTDADLRADGSWEVTISAPVDMPRGVTRSYDVHAQCAMNPTPYFVEESGDDEAEADDPTEAILTYALRPLRVTGFGPSEVAEGDGPSGASTTTAPPTTSTTAAPAAGPSKHDDDDARRPSAPTADAVADRTPTPAPDVTFVDDSAERIAAARAELAAAGVDVSSMSDEQVLASSRSAVPAAPVDGGIPWWAFALAAMLAVSGVLAFGVRRTSLVAQLDRQTGGD